LAIRHWLEEWRIEEAVGHSPFAIGWKNEELKKLLALGHSPLARRMEN
jgi:hypothetical protein